MREILYQGLMQHPIYFSGQFLLATPGMADRRFERSIIAICSHDEHGALGINIGQISKDITFHAILDQFDISAGECEDELVYVGGPVEMHRGFVLHSLDFNLSETLQVGDRWGLSSSLEILEAIVAGKGPRNWMIATGYAGWGAGQLEEELTQNGWSVTPGNTDWLFQSGETDKWHMAWQEQGIDPGRLSGQFGSA
ncbi:MAG: YqgE/AlgH family protein [Pseudomonadota bacterium]